MSAALPPSFVVHGPDVPASPVVLSVPHAGRDYPAALLRDSRVTGRQLEILEDRHADRLVEPAIDAGYATIIACRARAWIDLNRHEREVDPEMIDPRPASEGLIRSAKVTGGLGLMPRRLRGSGDILHRRVSAACLEERIARDHRPYHAQLSAMLRAAHARFGVAILLDVHSMPPLAAGWDVVVGDLFGRSAQARFPWLVRDIATVIGYRVAMNTPYAGGHILSTHGAPARGIHAIQIEIDRTLYLESDLSQPRATLGGIDALILQLAAALSEEALGRSAGIAAE